eukprot:2489959-Pleurochrysis_carterae.AAC.1
MQCGREGALASAVSLQNLSIGKSCSQVGSSRFGASGAEQSFQSFSLTRSHREQMVQSKGFNL